MKVYSEKSTLNAGRMIRLAGYILLIVGLTFLNASRPLASATPPEQKAKEPDDKANRDARKAIRAGKYQDALKTYRDMIDASPRDIPARLGASLAYLKLQDYVRCFDQATEALNIDPKNAHAHALAGISLLRS